MLPLLTHLFSHWSILLKRKHKSDAQSMRRESKELPMAAHAQRTSTSWARPMRGTGTRTPPVDTQSPGTSSRVFFCMPNIIFFN
jgi:hypothetical protein